MIRSVFAAVDVCFEGFCRFSLYSGVVAWNVTLIPLLLFVMDGMHGTDNTYLTQSTWLCYLLVRFLMVAYNGKQYILDLSLINLLLSFFSSGCVIFIQ